MHARATFRHKQNSIGSSTLVCTISPRGHARFVTVAAPTIGVGVRDPLSHKAVLTVVPTVKHTLEIKVVGVHPQIALGANGRHARTGNRVVCPST